MCLMGAWSKKYFIFWIHSQFWKKLFFENYSKVNHAKRRCLKLAVPALGGEKTPPVSPPQLFLSNNGLWSNFFEIFYLVKIMWLKVSNLLYRQCQGSSTHFRGLWKMVDFSKNRHFLKILFYLVKYAFYGHATLGPKSF